MHRLFHADRQLSLKEDQDLALDENNLSRFGEIYWPAIKNKPYNELTDAERREFHLEQIRSKPPFSVYASRLQSIFAANSIEEAIQFANHIVPRPNYHIPIFEIFSNTFWTFDMNWLDYESNETEKLENYRHYWFAEISNHRPAVGERKLPKLEVQVALPAKVGKIVGWAPAPNLKLPE